MKAALYRSFGGPDVLEYVDIADPVPAEGEVLVRLEAACVAPFDWKLRQGLLQAHFKTDFPFIPGREGAGIVEAVGTDVTDLKPGDRVSVLAGAAKGGIYAEKVALPLRNIALIPPSLAPAQAAAGLNAGINALVCFDMAMVKRGERVLVHGGAGAVGGILVQLCHAADAHVAATCRASNKDYVASLGADTAIAYDNEDFATLRDIDVVFDLMGGAVHDRSYAVMRRGGRLIYLNALPIVDRGAEFGVTVTLGYKGPADDPEMIARVVGMMASGVFRPQVSSTMPLSEAAEAHRLIQSGQVTRGRLVLTM
ncbi:NADP-dependent oxidoreductase [Rhizobium sp. LjRoot254]|uniref:NADP-dependent oxidoreductase n=1 Tax=Rhizobium sp. LjRoot254 TaxID=3342297 RepID=UPI003ECF5C4D